MSPPAPMHSEPPLKSSGRATNMRGGRGFCFDSKSCPDEAPLPTSLSTSPSPPDSFITETMVFLYNLAHENKLETNFPAACFLCAALKSVMFQHFPPVNLAQINYVFIFQRTSRTEAHLSVGSGFSSLSELSPEISH